MAKAQKPREFVTWWPTGNNEALKDWVGSRNWALVEGNERDPDAPLPVFLSFAKDVTGRLACTGLIIGWRPFNDRGGALNEEVTARVLRELHLPELVRRARAVADLPDEFGQAIGRLLEGAPPLRVRPGPRGHGDDHFRSIAEAYRHALETSPRSPVAWLAKQLDVPEVTLRRWIQRARDKGFLGASTPGRAGEQSDKPKKGTK